MVKECKVILNNDFVTVVDFGGEKVQLPSIHSDAKKIFVELKDGKYSITDGLVDTPKVEEDTAEDFVKEVEEKEETSKKKRSKKTTVEEETIVI